MTNPELKLDGLPTQTEIESNGNKTTKLITDRANSFAFRYDGVGSDVKIYYDTYDQLREGIDAVYKAKAYIEARKDLEGEDIEQMKKNIKIGVDKIKGGDTNGSS